MKVDRVSVGSGYTMNPRPYETLRTLHGEAKAEVRREVASSTGRAAPAEEAGS